MKFSILILLLLTNLSAAQSVYFVKYKSVVPHSVIGQKITGKSVFSKNNFRASQINYDADFLAKGTAKGDEVLGRIVKIFFKDYDPGENELAGLLNDPDVEYIQKGRTYRINYTPNDSLLSEQWALQKIQAFDAWDITTGSDTVLLAIIDTGIDYLHPDLMDKIKINPGESGTDQNGKDKKSNNIDDDGNGFIDDYMGWDFTDRQGFPFDSSGGDYLDWDNDPYDYYGHGTYVAGAAAAETNNFKGIAGAAPGINILNVRAFDPGGYGEEDDVAAAILYAVRMGAKVINMSFGDNSFSFVLRDVIRYAYSQNVVLVASSGNSGSSQPHYPSGYSEVISVGNSTDNDYVSSNSNWGSTLDLVAPGSLIKTTARNASYSIISGTSMAAPFVSAAAALVLSKGNFTNDEIRQILKSSSDDIGSQGWDLRSGAGRLNLFRALQVTAPSVIRFDNPRQDFATLNDTLKINATVLSAYFTNYEMYLGTGVNPDNWSLLKSGQNQFSSTELYNLSLSGMPDSTYTLRLVVYQSNGRTTEERVNFHINRQPPSAELITIGPALYGSESTIMASVYSEVPSTVKMYYRIAQSAGEFNFVTLDGFATNNQFVKYLHYGFIPKQLIEPETVYEVFLEAENLTGLKTTLRDSSGSNFFIKTSFNAEYATEYVLDFGLQFGQLYPDPVNITRNDNSEIFFNGFFPGTDLYYGIYRFEGNEFLKIDSIKNKIPRDVGDFNGNGMTDVLNTAQRNGYIDEQVYSDSAKFSNKMADSSGGFWASKVEDIDNDGQPEVLVFSSDTTISVWNIDNNLQKTDSIKLQNFTSKWYGGNRFNYPKIITADFNDNGKREIWAVDSDGDILGYEFSSGSFVPVFSLSTGLFGSAEYITEGDFNGDGSQDIAVLLRSIQNLYVAPFNYLLVFDKTGILFEQAFVDPSAEFNTNFNAAYNSVRLVDIDNDNKDELITFSFPYSYIFKHSVDAVKIISYKDNINSRSIFTADLNKNGVREVAFPYPDGIRFIEFASSGTASVPSHLEGYSLDSSAVHLKWSGSGDLYRIFRGISRNDLKLYDSVAVPVYHDSVVENRRTYFYAIQSYEAGKPQSYSGLSAVISVFTHNRSRISGIESKSANSIEVRFSEKINTTVLNLRSFIVEAGYPLPSAVLIPSSVSPSTQYSYLLSFGSSLPEGINTLVIKDLKDNYGSPVVEEGINFIVNPAPQSEEFYVTSHQIINPYLIKVGFNLAVDKTSASDIDAYSFEPSNRVEKVELDNADQNAVYLHLERRKPVGAVGIEYKLSIKDIFSSESTGKIKINSGAGSIIVLTSFADDLSDVFVYPNPVKAGAGERKITFAGLPQRAKIIIFTLNGKQLKTIEENNGDGGASIDLNDDSGNEFTSGIYIYRVVRLDETNNEVEEKLGKFAVIK